MSRSLKRILIALGSSVGLVVLGALAVPLLLDLNRYKPGWETAASHALGMEVRVGGRLGMGFFPGFHITMEDGRIFNEHGMTFASAKRIRLGIEPLALLRGEFRLRRMDLTQLRLSIERNPDGRLSVERLRVAALLGALEGVRVSLSNGTLLYADRTSGGGVEATDFHLAVSRLRFARGSLPLWKGLSLKAEFACREIRTENLTMTALKVSVDCKDGVFQLEPATMGIFGGKGVGNLVADLSCPLPLYHVRCSLPRFRIEDFLKVLSPEGSAEGTMDFTANLSMQGKTLSQLVQTAAGEISLRGDHLTLVGTDLDRELSRFESSESFNLVDAGAVFLAGPLGLAVTKGYNFASLFRGSGGNSSIGTVVSDWGVERGVATAKDVAMATAQNRIALQGGLDFVNQRFADVTVAVVDAGGCARVRQAIRGPFEKPQVEKPHFLKSLAGPVLGLFRKTRHVFPTRSCKAFYSGSVAPPK